MGSSAYLLTILSYKLLNIALSAGQCYNTGNFTTNSTYEKNLNIILSSLASKVTANQGFYYGSIGKEPDKVYARAVCRGDSFPESCANCVRSAIPDIMSNCPNRKEGRSFGAEDGPCFVRYSNSSFLGNLELDSLPILYNTGEITTNLTQFDETWESLMDQLVKKASGGSSSLKFATKTEDLTSFQKIYALMQCTPDLSQNNCDICLRQSVADYISCCHGRRGGIVRKVTCIFRWEMYPFYNEIAVGPTPSPPPPGAPPPQTNATSHKEGIASGTVVMIVVSSVIFIALVGFISVFLKRKKAKEVIKNQEREDDEIETLESLQFDFSTIQLATNNFSVDRKLGQGGFGAVYKGKLSDGQEIAVKRLSRNSGQGEIEFKNEVLLVARLQHRNLVRLRGFCLERNERILVYEFVRNSSLDNFIFDPIKRLLLNWETRYKIIKGIARGILYLHEDSRWRIIHRDLKASNILLDENMIPKLSDFGMARLFDVDQTQGNTRRIVGTFGYMAPEYIMHGHFSVKSDVYSFGVLVLEIISGQKNTSFCKGEEGGDLLSYAWKKWKEGRTLNLVDPTSRVGSTSEIVRCVHIGLLCVQENEAHRPTMASVVLMLTSQSFSLALPSKPAFCIHTTLGQDQRNSNTTRAEYSITELDPR